MSRQKQWTRGPIPGLFSLLLLTVVLSAALVFGDPTGGSISNPSTDTGPTVTPDSRADARGTITTMVLTATQQDQRWKGYVGNVTGSLTLDDADQFTIYDWALTTINGQVYASRNGTLDWTSVSCAPRTLINSESTYFSMSGSNVDRINATFNATAHKAFTVGSTNLLADTCNSTATYVNDTRANNPVDSSAIFQEVLITDNAGNSLVFMTSIDDNSYGYNRNSTDFQLIVPENITGVANTYYFYVELQ